MELHPGFPIRICFSWIKVMALASQKKKNSVAVEGTQLSPLVIKQTTWLDSNELKHQQGRNQRWKRSIRPMELFAGPHHLTGQLPCYLQQALTNCTLSSILHNIVLEAAHLSAVGHGMVPASQPHRLHCWNCLFYSQRAISCHQCHAISPAPSFSCCGVKDSCLPLGASHRGTKGALVSGTGLSHCKGLWPLCIPATQHIFWAIFHLDLGINVL